MDALNQAAKELPQRFDFRGTGASVSWAGEEAVSIEAETEERRRAGIEVFKEKLIKRGISVKAFEVDDPKPSGPAEEPRLRHRAAVHRLPVVAPHPAWSTRGE